MMGLFETLRTSCPPAVTASSVPIPTREGVGNSQRPRFEFTSTRSSTLCPQRLRASQSMTTQECCLTALNSPACGFRSGTTHRTKRCKAENSPQLDTRLAGRVQRVVRQPPPHPVSSASRSTGKKITPKAHTEDNRHDNHQQGV